MYATRILAVAAVAIALSGCSPLSGDVEAQRAAKGALSSIIGPLKIRGVSTDRATNVVYVALCRETAPCAIYAAGEGDRLIPVLADPAWDYLWVAAEGEGQILAVRIRPGSDMVADAGSEIVRFRPGAASPEVLRAESGRVSSLHSVGDGAFAYFASTGLHPVDGCAGSRCRYVPTAQRLVVVAADGAVTSTMDDVVDGLAGEAFHPWAERLWVIMPYNTARSRQLAATITGGPTPVLTRFNSTAELAAALPSAPTSPVQDLARYNMIAAPFRGLGAVAASEAIDLTAPGRAVLVAPTAGPHPDAIEIQMVSRSQGQDWRAGQSRTYGF